MLRSAQAVRCGSGVQFSFTANGSRLCGAALRTLHRVRTQVLAHRHRRGQRRHDGGCMPARPTFARRLCGAGRSGQRLRRGRRGSRRGPPGITTTRVPTFTRSNRSETSSFSMPMQPDETNLPIVEAVGAVDAIDGGTEIHRGHPADCRAAGHEARQIRLAFDHLGRRVPIRPLGLARDLLHPVQVKPSRPTRTPYRIARRHPERIEIGVRGIDDQRSRRFLGRNVTSWRRRFAGSGAVPTSAVHRRQG